MTANRAYVRAPREATLAEFYQAWAAGRNFVTNGPMLLLETAEGDRPGAVIALPEQGGEIGVRLKAASEQHQVMTAAEIIVNGQAVQSFESENGHTCLGQASLSIEQGSWIAARCVCRDDLLDDAELALYTMGGPNAAFRQRPSRLRYAHTSPIYVTVGGQGAAVRQSIEEGIQMLDRFEAFARKTASPRYLPATLVAVERAREELRVKLSHAVAN